MPIGGVAKCSVAGGGGGEGSAHHLAAVLEFTTRSSR